jgi:hypothetical protein
MIKKVLEWFGFAKTREEKTILIRPPRRRRMVSLGIEPEEDGGMSRRLLEGYELTDYSWVGTGGKIDYEQTEERERVNEERVDERDKDEGVLKKLKGVDPGENWDETDLKNPYGRSGLRIGDFR